MKEPVYIDWAITSNCNLNCRHCGGMSGDDFTNREAVRVAREIMELSPRWVILEGGEPLLRGDLLRIGGMFKEKDIEVFVITNGNAFNQKRLRNLDTFSPNLIFSVDGADASVYEHTKRGADFESAIKWVEKCSEQGLFHGITTVLSKLNLDQVENLIRLVEKFGGKSINFLPLKPFGDDEESSKYYSKNALSPEDHEKMIRKIYNIESDLNIFYDEPFLWNLSSKYNLSLGHEEGGGITISKVRGCAANHSLYIRTSGNVRPCMFCSERLSFGNVREESLKEIWQRMKRSEVISNWIDQTMRTGNCGECSQFESCHGCLARTTRLFGDTTKSDPCCPLAKQPKQH